MSVASTPPVPSSPTIDQTVPVSPTSNSRPGGRLRGLSYLRNYTHNHLLSRDHSSSSESRQRPSGPLRATSYPSPSTNPRASPSSPTVQRSTNDLFGARSSNIEKPSSPSATQNAASRLISDPQPSTTAGSSSATTSLANNPPDDSNTGRSMARTRSATVGETTAMPGTESQPRGDADASANGPRGNPQLPSIRFSAHQDPRAQRPSLVFSPMIRILPTGKEVIKVGRYSEREAQPPTAANTPSAAAVGFKSKVVSRRHCEFWFQGGRWYIKDVKSSSGTFLNHIRLSSPGAESRPFPVNDGDIVQLGIDFKGGEEMIFRCVKIRVEFNKGWQQAPTSFNVQSHKRLRELNGAIKQGSGGSSQDCSICLGPIAPCQSLFVAPCSHTWHYKCIRVIINGPHWPHFICPNCRTVADLEAELDEPIANDEEWEKPPPEADRAVQPPASTPTAPSNAVRQQSQDSSESTAALANVVANPPATPSQLEPHRIISTPTTSDDSDMQGTSEDLEPPPRRGSTSLSEGSLPEQPSSSSVSPVNIRPRKPVNGERTPSPNGIPPYLSGEGPMTPRNDVGPFIFDGSAGRAPAVETNDGALTPTNLDAATHTTQQTS